MRSSRDHNHADANDHVHELLADVVTVAHPRRARQPAQRRHVPLKVRHRRVPVGAAHLRPTPAPPAPPLRLDHPAHDIDATISRCQHHRPPLATREK